MGKILGYIVVAILAVGILLIVVGIFQALANCVLGFFGLKLLTYNVSISLCVLIYLVSLFKGK